MMWNWRMLLATGEARYADLLERSLYNDFLSSVSLDGQRYFYVNPLQSRAADPMHSRGVVERPEWFGCACCPPNVMRQIAMVGHYAVTVDESGGPRRSEARVLRRDNRMGKPWDLAR
jgi:DUF1680 family protein